MVRNVSCQDAWSALTADPAAALVDCRTEAEWQQIGLPDLGEAGKKPVLACWQYLPGGALNPGFVQELAGAGLTPGQPIYFLCRSGARSLAAAEAAAAAGYGPVFNIAEGFEGPPDAMGRRGTLAGWKAMGLPWEPGK
jgi:rhodanese-related sulfurtransferase